MSPTPGAEAGIGAETPLPAIPVVDGTSLPDVIGSAFGTHSFEELWRAAVDGLVGLVSGGRAAAGEPPVSAPGAGDGIPRTDAAGAPPAPARDEVSDGGACETVPVGAAPPTPATPVAMLGFRDRDSAAQEDAAWKPGFGTFSPAALAGLAWAPPPASETSSGTAARQPVPKTVPWPPGVSSPTVPAGDAAEGPRIGAASGGAGTLPSGAPGEPAIAAGAAGRKSTPARSEAARPAFGIRLKMTGRVTQSAVTAPDVGSPGKAERAAPAEAPLEDPPPAAMRRRAAETREPTHRELPPARIGSGPVVPPAASRRTLEKLEVSGAGTSTRVAWGAGFENGGRPSATHAAAPDEPAAGPSGSSNAPPEPGSARFSIPEPVRRVNLQIDPAGEVRLHIVERAGKIHVMVRSKRSSVTSALRDELGTLVHRVQTLGFQVDAWSPGHPPRRDAAPSAGAEDRRGNENAAGGGSGSGHGGGEGGERRQREDPPAWAKDFESLPAGSEITQEEEVWKWWEVHYP